MNKIEQITDITALEILNGLNKAARKYARAKEKDRPVLWYDLTIAAMAYTFWKVETKKVAPRLKSGSH